MKVSVRKITVRLLACLSALLLACLAAEIVLRVLEDPGVDSPDALRVHRAAADPELVWEYNPGAATETAEVAVRINPQGFRDDPFPDPAPEGAPRIVVIGDSVASGWGIPMSAAYPQVLERLLGVRAQATGKPDPVVYNLAVNGYSTRQELRLLETRGLALHPDLVIWNYVLNDPDDLDGGLSRHFVTRIRLWELLKRGMRSVIESSQDLPREYHQRIHARHHDAVREHFAQLAKFSKTHSIPVLLTVTPVFGGDGSATNLGPATYPLAPLHSEIESLCATHPPLQFLDARPALHKAAQADPAKPVAFDVWHPTAHGHEVIARLLDGLVGERYLGGR